MAPVYTATKFGIVGFTESLAVSRIYFSRIYFSRIEFCKIDFTRIDLSSRIASIHEYHYSHFDNKFKNKSFKINVFSF